MCKAENTIWTMYVHYALHVLNTFASFILIYIMRNPSRTYCQYEGVSKSFQTELIMKYVLTFGITC
jgi:hypothetical protein